MIWHQPLCQKGSESNDMSQISGDQVQDHESELGAVRKGGPGERCPKCNGVRGRVIARVHVVKKYNDGFKIHEYKYLRLTHRKMLRDGTLKRTYCYWDERKAQA